MAVRSIQTEYAQWLDSAPTAGLLMQAVEFNWNKDGTPRALYLGNHITTATNVIYETGAQVSLTPYQFEVTQPDRSGTTEASVTLTAPLPGPLFNEFQGFRGYQIAFQVIMLVRYYILPSLLYTPLSTKPERYFVTSITYSRLQVSLEASMARLPRFRAGIPYTVDEYPGLYEF